MSKIDLVSILVRQLCEVDDHESDLAEDALYDFVSNILLNGCELYVRGDAGKKQLKNADLINYVLTCYQKKVA